MALCALLCLWVLLGAHRRAGRQLSLDAIENQLRSRMLQILNKSNPSDVEIELGKLQSELLARGRWPAYSMYFARELTHHLASDVMMLWLYLELFTDFWTANMPSIFCILRKCRWINNCDRYLLCRHEAYIRLLNLWRLLKWYFYKPLLLLGPIQQFQNTYRRLCRCKSYLITITSGEYIYSVAICKRPHYVLHSIYPCFLSDL